MDQFCWYPDKNYKKNKQRMCLPLYSQADFTTFGWESQDEKKPTYLDFEKNGKYCESGLAYPVSKDEGKCTSFDHMKFDEKKIEEPFKCNPYDQTKKCQLYFNIEDDDLKYVNDQAGGTQRGFVENRCKCALDGVTNIDEDGKKV